jgi:serine/threonine protein kinase
VPYTILLSVVPKTLSHYWILESIGAGGMGVVYHAHDEQLERDVAIKVLPPGMLADESARRWFRKEALSLAKLNHPNIATIFEFGNEDETDFLVTELIPGISLDTKLSTGPLPLQEVTKLAVQLTQGLAAAHEQGIVHRDLKPGNLRITPDGRLKILDFGLAQLIPQHDDPNATVTLTHSLPTTAGTLPYMAPEQLRGITPGPGGDIWAAGVVLYEMATGKRPFPEKSGPLLIDAILNQKPPAPRSLNRQISPGMENIILKAIDKDPAHRYQTIREMETDLERLTSGISPRAKPRSPKRWYWGAVALVVLGLGLGVGYRFARKPPTQSVSTPVKTRRSVAVIGLKNLSGQPQQNWLSTALEEMLTTELSAGEQLRTIPGETVSRMKADLALPDSASMGEASLAQVHKLLGADMVVLGSYLDLQGSLRVDLRVQDAARGETLATISESGTEKDIFTLVNQLGAQLRQKCGVASISPADAATIAASHPADPRAAQLYADGLARLRAFDALGARDILLPAIAAEPNYAPSHVALSSAWDTLGYAAKAKEEILTAAELSGSLAREDRLEIQARAQEMNGQHQEAVQTYSTLFNFFPDNLEYGLGLATAQMSAGNASDAYATLDALRKLSPPMNADPRIDLNEALAANLLGDPKRGIAAAERASKRALLLGDRLTAAAALSSQMTVHEHQGDHVRALALGDQARKLYEGAGSKDGAARVQIQTGVLLMNTGDREGAAGQFGSALATLQEIGDEAFAARALQMTARLKQEDGDLKGAEPLNEQVVATYRRIDAKTKLSNALWHRGALMKQLGNYRQADASLQESLELAKTAGPRSLTSSILLDLADLSTHRGDLKDAQAKYNESLASAQQNFEDQVSSIQMARSDLLVQQGDLPGARRLLEELLKLSEDAQQQEDAAYCKFLLAEVAVEDGRASEAEALARQAADGLSGLGSLDEEPYALGTLIRSLLAQNKLAEAQQIMAKAKELAQRSQDVHIQMDVATNSGRVLVAAGKTAESLAVLSAVLDRAIRLGCVSCALQVRLALGEAELKASRTAAGRTTLSALQKDATKRGFLLIARKASSPTS